MKKHILLLFSLVKLLLFTDICLLSQEDNSYYFDDGGISTCNNVIKINTLSILNGDLPFFYERVFIDEISIEIGAGVLLPFYNIENNIFYSESSFPITNPTGGYSIWIQPRFYSKHTAPESSYIGFMYRKRFYNQNNEQIVFTDFAINIGQQIMIKKRMTCDFSLGAGYKIQEDNSSQIKLMHLNNFILPIGLRFGYKLL